MPRRLENEGHVKAMVKDWFADWSAWSYAPIQTGMGEHGIHDRIACVPLVVTHAMVGKTVGVFVSIEAKAPGRRGEKRRGMSVHQERTLTKINEAAGFSVVVDGYEDILELEELLMTFQHRGWRPTWPTTPT